LPGVGPEERMRIHVAFTNKTHIDIFNAKNIERKKSFVKIHMKGTTAEVKEDKETDTKSIKDAKVEYHYIIPTRNVNFIRIQIEDTPKKKQSY
jgi:hypothetical protein